MFNDFNDIFDFFGMIGTYEQRNVDCTEAKDFVIDTSYATDRDLPYETAIAHQYFRNNEWIILGWSATKEEAQNFHNEMVEYYSNHPDVESIKDVYENIIFFRDKI